MAIEKCTKCGKPIKENTDGDSRYCQGHSCWKVVKEKKVKKGGFK